MFSPKSLIPAAALAFSAAATAAPLQATMVPSYIVLTSNDVEQLVVTPRGYVISISHSRGAKVETCPVISGYIAEGSADIEAGLLDIALSVNDPEAALEETYNLEATMKGFSFVLDQCTRSEKPPSIETAKAAHDVVQTALDGANRLRKIFFEPYP